MYILNVVNPHKSGATPLTIEKLLLEDSNNAAVAIQELLKEYDDLAKLYTVHQINRWENERDEELKTQNLEPSVSLTKPLIKILNVDASVVLPTKYENELLSTNDTLPPFLRPNK